MITLLAKLLKVLNAEAAPGQISAAFCMSMVFAFMPFLTLQHILIVFLVLVLRVNLTAFLLGWLVFSAVAFLLDPFFHWLGMAVLSAAPLADFWGALYDSGVLRLTRFNNTVVMGGLITSLVLAAPLYGISNALVRRYRQHFMTWIQKTRIAQIIKGSRVYSAYRTVSGWRKD